MNTFKINIMLLIFLILFIISGCTSKPANELHKDETKKEGHHEEESSEVMLTDEQIRLMDIETDKLGYQNISGYIKVNGEVMINPDQESKVGSIIAGRVRKIFVKEGSFVKAGETLAVIENTEIINVQVDYLNAKNEYEFSKKEYERQLKLNSENIGSKKTLNELETNYKKALANYKTLEEKLSVYKIGKERFENLYKDTVANLQHYFNITSPISGNVVKRNLTVGQYVEPSTDLFNIINISTVFVDLNIYEQDLQYVCAGQKVSLEVSVNPYEVYEGQVIYVNKVFDDEKRTVKVRVAINNKHEKLLPFMFVSAKIYITEESVLAVPISALETEGDNKFIFAKTRETMATTEEHKESQVSKEKNSDEKNEKRIVFKKMPVNTGISDDKYIQIFPLNELKTGSYIVSKGTFYLKSELKKGELGEHGE